MKYEFKSQVGVIRQVAPTKVKIQDSGFRRINSIFAPSSFIVRLFIFCLLFLGGCLSSSEKHPEVAHETPSTASPVASPVTLESSIDPDLLRQSWAAYRQRFVQADGRVIDREAGDRSTSEAQAYAMLRAVLIDDPTTFAKTLQWGEVNLRRQTGGKLTDRLWIWKWGRSKAGWGVIDGNFASDADIDVITALILASRRWHQPEYLNLARAKLQDLWKLSTVVPSSGKRYLLPGPREAFQPQPNTIELNPSYFAPYAFRLFAQADPTHNWLALVDSSYRVLENATQLSAVGLPGDWVLLDTQTGILRPASASNRRQYGFDAYRVWWRVSLDAAWFQEPLAISFMQQHLKHLEELWHKQGRIPAQISLQGQPLVNYEATSQYAMVYAALRFSDPVAAEEILQRKLMPQYRNGFWDNNSAYYTQNLVWLGLLPPTIVSTQLLHSPQ